MVSIGSGGGVTGLWLLRGMRPDGVLTALDGDPEQLRAARAAFAEAGVADRPDPADLRHPRRGPPPALLGRLRHGRLRRPAARVRRPAGRAARPGARRRHAGAATGCWTGGRIADRTVRDPQTVAWREIARAVREDEDLVSAVLPIGAGLLVATKRS